MPIPGEPSVTAPTPTTPRSSIPLRPEPTTIQGTSSQPGPSLRPDSGVAGPARRKKRNHRGGNKKKRLRRQSFAAPSEDGAGLLDTASNTERERHSQNTARSSFYRLHGGRNASNTSIESATLLDHRYV
jgi:hypothetical protein